MQIANGFFASDTEADTVVGGHAACGPPEVIAGALMRVGVLSHADVLSSGRINDYVPPLGLSELHV